MYLHRRFYVAEYRKMLFQRQDNLSFNIGLFSEGFYDEPYTFCQLVSPAIVNSEMFIAVYSRLKSSGN